MIPAIQEINFPSYATLHQATASFAEMGERTISTQVRIDGDVVPDFDGWEVSFKGERFILNTKDPQAVKDNSTRNSLVDLNFVSWIVNELKRYFFFEPTSIDASTAIADKYIASVNLPVEDFAALFNKVLKYYFGDKVVFSLYMSGQGQYSTDRALVEINYTYIWNVLVKFFEIYGVRWRIEYDESDDVYTIKAGWPTTDIDINDHDFEYGYKGGLVRFERQVQDVDIHNILLGRGGEKNIPYRYFKRVDPQNPDWAADPDAIPELANIYFDRLRDINFRWYVRGWMQNPNHDTSWEEDGYTYPSYTISSDSPYYFAYEKGRTDEKFNPVEYVRDLPSIEDYGERWGALDDNDDIFPTTQGVTRDPLGRIDETVAVSEIVTDDISAMAQNAAVEKSINRLSVSLNGETRTEFDLQSEEFTIPSGSTGNITYVPFGTDNTYPGLVRFDTDNSTVVAVSDGIEYPIDAIPAGTYRLKLHMVIARSGQATSATGTFGIENIILTTSTQETDAWKPTFDIWVKNIWGTEKQEGETDVQYAERVWLPILGDRVGNEAKIVFSTGFMSVSEDYEFPIVSYPVHDTSKSINGVPSEWRITLRKSDAEFDATGLYIPNASTGGKPVAGDKFFFIGIDMPHRYVTLAEEDLNTYKSAQLDTEAAISPTWIMNLDKVRVHTLEDQEYGLTLAERLAAGGKVWIKDKRFTPGERLQLYVQSITYTWNEPTVESPYIVPDIEVVLSDKVVAVDSVVQRIQNDVSSIKNQYARISDVEAVVRSVAEPIFLKKTGESDSSDSPTQFSSKVTSKGFRQGGVGGTGWGIYRDNTSVWAEAEAETRTRRLLRAVTEEHNTEGDTVFEADRIVVRKELQVNSLVINQISYLGGKEIISAAKIEVSKVIETDNGYVCYFDQRRNSVANNFVVNDIAMGQVFDPYNAELRYYKALVTAVDIDSITISKTQKVGSGVPRVGDVIVQYGNTTQSGRQYVIVRDVVGGGYERMLSGLNSLNADGDEYYFAGRESSGTGPRWFVGSHEQNGDYAEYENGVLTIKANVVFKQGQVIPGLSDLTDDVEALEYLKTALPKSDTIITGGLILSKVIALRDANNSVMSGINGDTSLSNIAAWYGGPMADKEASPTPASYAKSLFRFDGSGYLAGGNIYWNNQGYGGIPGITWSNDGTQDIVTIGANVRLASVDGDTVTDLLNAVNELMDLFEVVNGNIHVKNNRGFYSDSFISAGGLSDGGGSAGGNATLVAQTYGGTLSATGINPINFYSKEKVDELLLTAGSVRSVAGVSPESGDIPVASLKSALGLGTAAAYGVGSVASGNTGLVTGGSVYSAINEAVSSVLKMQGTTTTAISDGSTTNPVVIDGSSYTAKKGDVVMYGNKEFWWTGSAWEELGDEASWALKTTTISAGTGLTGGGTLASNRTISLSAASIASLALADSAYQKPSTGIPQTDLTSALSNKVDHGESAYNNLNDWFEIVDGNIHVKNNRGFYSDSFISAGGLSSGGGSEGASLAAVWASLKTNSDDYANEKINAYHIPIGSGLSVVNGVIVANNAGTVTSVKVGTTTYNPTDGVVSLPAYPTVPSTYALSSITGADDLKAIEALTGTSGFLKKTAANTWSLDTNTYLTGITSTMVTTALGYTPANVTALGDYLPLSAGTNKPLTDSLYIITGDTDKAIQFSYNSNHLAGASWRIISEGTGNLDTNYLSFQTGGSSGSATTWNTVLRMTMDTRRVGINTTPAYQLDVNGTARVTSLRIGTTTNAASSYIEWDENSQAWKLTGNFYATGWVSAGGVSSGGGASGVDLAAVWANFTANTGEGLNKVINVAHIPALASLSGNLTVSRISDIETWISGKGYLTSHQSLDGYVNDLTRTPSSGGNYVSSVTKSGKTITVTYATLPTALKNPNALTFGSKTYDGSAARTITASDLGALTAHQTVTLASGTNDGTLKLTVGSTTTDNIAVKGLGSMAYASTGDYVKLSSATAQTIAVTGSTDTPLYVKSNNGSGCYIGFRKSDNTNWGFLGMTNNGAVYAVSGAAYKIWNESNDGASSGLDADLLDGQQGSYYAAASSLNNYLPLSAGSTKPLTDSLYILTGETDKFIQFSYNANHQAGAAWRIVSQGTGSGDTNYLSFQTGGSSSSATDWLNVLRLTMDTRRVGIGVDSPAYALDVLGDTRTSGKLYIGTSGAYLEYNSTNGVHLVVPSGKGFYTEGFISAGGVSSGGGTSGVDLTAVWNNLIANTGEGLNKKIHTSHLPTVTITGTNISGTGTYSGTGGNASTLTLNLTAVDTTYSPGNGISISTGNVISLDGSEYYSAKTSRTANTVLAAPNGSAGVASFRKLVAADIPDLSGVYLPLNVGEGKTITSTSNAPLTINSTTTSNEVGFRYQLGGESKAFFGYNANASFGAYMFNYNGPHRLGITDAGVAHFDGNALLHAGNYTSYVNTTNFPGLNKVGTVTSVAAGTGLSGGTITTSGTISLAASGVTAGTYYKTTVDTYGRVTSGSYANLSAAINGDLTEGSSNPVDADFYIAQYAGGGTSTTSYHRRPHSALYGYIKGKLDSVYVPLTRTVNGKALSANITLTLDDIGNGSTRSLADYLPLTGGTMNTTNVVTNLNADLLDGLHATDFVRWYKSSNATDFTSYFPTAQIVTKYNSTDGLSGDGAVMTIPTWQGNNANNYYNVQFVFGLEPTTFRIRAIHSGSVNYTNTVYTTANANLSTVDWACKTLTASGNISTSGYVSVGTGGANSYVGSDAATNIFLHNSSGYILVVDGVNVRRGATAATATLGTTTYPWAGITATSADFRLTNFTDFHIYRNNSGGSAGITYYSAAQTTNYWNVGMDPIGTAYGGRFYWYYTGSYLAYLTTSGNFVATGAITAGSASDARLKTNIQSLSAEAARRIVMALNPVTFTWNEKATELFDQYKGDDLGMIAQEVEPYLPQAVGTIFENYKRLDYTKFITPLISVAQDHESRIRQLEAENRELRKRLNMN